jgi:hypothetical protein
MTGAMHALTRASAAWLRDAEQTGDLYLMSSLANGLGNLAWLVRDAPAEARDRVDAVTGLWSRRAYLHQHWLALWAHCQIDLYEGQPRQAVARIERDAPDLTRSQFLRVHLISILWRELRARAALAAVAGDDTRARERLAAVRADVRWIRSTRAAWGQGLADLLDASCEWLEGRSELAVAGLRRAVAGFDASGLALHAAAARWRLGRVVGGDEGELLRRNALRFMEDGGARVPERLVRMLAPAFEARGTG